MEKYNKKKNKNLDFLSFIGPYVSDSNFENIRSCGSFLEFYADETLEHKKLKWGNFCKNRFCPYCNFIKSRKKGLLISTCLRYLKEQGYSFIFLTLTVPNVKGDQLEESIREYSSSFAKLTKRRKFKRAILGYVRNLEITYNKSRMDFHPHYHCLLVVKKSYFNNPNHYISRDEWLTMWRESTGDYSITQVDVRKVDISNNKVISEVSKYSAKDADYLINKEVFHYFYTSLKGKQSVSYSGVFRDAKKLYDGKQLEYLKDKDLINYVYLITYVWGPKEYEMIGAVPLSEEEKDIVNNKLNTLEEIKDLS